MTDSVWLPFAYQYLVGGAIFALGMVVAVRSGALDLGRRGGKWLAGLLVGGFAMFAGLHALFQFVFPYM